MMKLSGLTLVFILLCSQFVFAQNVFHSYEQEYKSQARFTQSALFSSGGIIQASGKLIPATTLQAYQLFSKICISSIENYKFKKTLTVQSDGALKRLSFNCEMNDGSTTKPENMQFIVSLYGDKNLADLQMLRLKEASQSSDSLNNKKKQTRELVLSVAAGTLAAGLLANAAYPDQDDKVLHAVAGSLIAASTSAVAYYGFDLTENQSFWIGLVTGVLAGVLKESYDKQHPDRHTVDNHDAFVTGAGAAMGALSVRFKF